MTATPSKLGADMTDEQIDEIAQPFLHLGDGDTEHDSIDWRGFARALLARQPAAIDKQEATIRDRARRFLSEFVRQTGISMSDHVQEVMLNLFLRYAAPLGNEASKPAAQQTLSDGAQFFACYLIDNCENEVVREESVQAWLGKMLASPRYHPAAPSVEQDERGALTDEQIGEALLDTLVFKLHANNDQVRRFRDAFHFASACDAMLVDVEEVKQLCRDFSSRTGSVYIKDVESALDGIASRAASTSANVAQGAKLAVWYGSMPESNGKTNWTAILHKGDLAEGHTIDRSEYPDRVRYAADCVRYLIGELKERPWILDYDADKHSGYVANVAQGAEAQSGTHEAWTYEQVVQLCEIDGVDLPIEYVEWVAEKMTRAANDVLQSISEMSPAGLTEREQFIWNLGHAAALEKPASGNQEPVGLVLTNDKGEKYGALLDSNIEERTRLYTAQPAQTALTDDARWIDASKDVPSDEREVIVFLNGHCGLLDDEARKGGGWGIRLGWYDHDKRAWYVHGQKELFVTHWQDEPSSPLTAAQSASGDTK